jgi:hypothetical protein
METRESADNSNTLSNDIIRPRPSPSAEQVTRARSFDSPGLASVEESFQITGSETLAGFLDLLLNEVLIGRPLDRPQYAH